MAAGISFADACLEPDLFGDWFGGDTWANWRVVDKAIFGDPLTDAETAVFRELTGREYVPGTVSNEIWLVIGRRGGKDVKTAALAVYLATIGVQIYEWDKRLVRGERGVVQALAVDRDQSKVVFGYISGMFEKPVFRKLVRRQTADAIDLTNGFAIEVTTSDQRRVRGRTVVAAIFDEVAFWKSENSTSPDVEVYRAVKPATATMPGAMLIGISSPYARKGLLWQKYKKHFGNDGKVLVVQAPTWVMNPTVSRSSDIILDAYEDDPEAARAEFGAQFRDDISDFISRDSVTACIEPGVRERPPRLDCRYVAFIDPSGGSADSMTLGIAHREADNAILDLVREVKPPFSPEAVVAEFTAVMKLYRISEAIGDRYAGEWCQEAFRRAGVFYNPSARPKSELYGDLLPLINSRRCLLLENDRLVNQLVGLERRVGRSRKDTIDHAPAMHDDVANAVAGVLVKASTYSASNPEDEKKWKQLWRPRKVA